MNTSYEDKDVVEMIYSEWYGDVEKEENLPGLQDELAGREDKHDENF